MKIVALHTDFRLYWPARLQYLCNSLKKRGNTLTVVEIAGAGSNYEFAGQINHEKLDWICLFPKERIEDIDPFRAKEEVKKVLDELNPAVVLSGAFAFTSGAAALEWTKENNRAVVVFDDMKKEDLPRSFLVNAVKHIFYSYVDAIFCPAPDWIETYRDWGIRSQAIFFGVDVVDNDFWAKQEGIANPLELPEKYFLCVGRQIECKNFETAIEAFNQLLDGCQNIDLVLVGEGEQRKKLEELANKKDINRFHFLPFQSPDQLREIYQRAFALILPSNGETWGLVVNEAMAAGLPILVSNECGCCQTLVKEDKNGFVFFPSDMEQWRGGMEQLLNLSEEEITQMGRESKNIISKWGLEKFSDGAIRAIDYAICHKRKPLYFLGKYLLRKWKGRYNPI